MSYRPPQALETLLRSYGAKSDSMLILRAIVSHWHSEDRWEQNVQQLARNLPQHFHGKR